MDVKKNHVRGDVACVYYLISQFLHDGNEIIYFDDCIQISNEKNLLHPVPFTTVRGMYFLDFQRECIITSLFWSLCFIIYFRVYANITYIFLVQISRWRNLHIGTF